MDLNYIIALIILATKNQDIQQFTEAYGMVVNSIENDTDLEFKNKEIINRIFNVYNLESKDTPNVTNHISFVDAISNIFQGNNANYYKYKMVADIIEYPLVDKFNLIKELDDSIGSIDERKEILYLKLNVYNHELNYIEIENLISKIKALDV